MGNRAFDDLALFKPLLEYHPTTLVSLEKNVRTHTARAAGGNLQAAAEASTESRKRECNDHGARRSLCNTLKKERSDVNNRVIGYVVWPPPITGLTPPTPATRETIALSGRIRRD